MDVKKVRKFDALLGTIVFPLLWPFKKKQLCKNPKKILLIQFWGIGETILTLPAIKSLRGVFPDAEVALLCTNRNKDVYFQNPNVNKVIVIDPSVKEILRFIKNNKSCYDLVIDFEEYLNTSTLVSFFTGKTSLGFSSRKRSMLYSKSIKYNDNQHCAETFMDLARVFHKISPIKELESLSYSPSDQTAINILIKKHKLEKKKIIAIAPSVAESSKSRVWPLKNFSSLIEKLEKEFTIVLLGGNSDKETVNTVIKGIEKKVVNLCGQMSLRELFYFTTKFSVLVSNDSGPMHIGSAQKVPTIGLFGPNTPLRFGPLGKNNIAVYKKSSCPFTPCINVHKGIVPDCLYSKSSKEYQQCMKAITVKEVQEAVIQCAGNPQK